MVVIGDVSVIDVTVREDNVVGVAVVDNFGFVVVA